MWRLFVHSFPLDYKRGVLYCKKTKMCGLMLDQGVMGNRTRVCVVPAGAEMGGWSRWSPDTRQPFALGRSSVPKKKHVFSAIDAIYTKCK